MSISAETLNEILKQTQSNSAQGFSTLVVFDLDSTLFNVSTRTQKIIDDFYKISPHPLLKNTQVQCSDWGLKEALMRSGFNSEQDLSFLNQLKDFWYQHFFSNEYLNYDSPTEGAIAYVQELHQAGATIKYLTGRDHKRMGKGTVDVLNKWGFPIQEDSLHLKIEKTEDDTLYKTNWFGERVPAGFKNIYFFENEPLIINSIIEKNMNIEIIFLDTTHARKSEITCTKLKKIKNFKR